MNIIDKYSDIQLNQEIFIFIQKNNGKHYVLAMVVIKKGLVSL